MQAHANQWSNDTVRTHKRSADASMLNGIGLLWHRDGNASRTPDLPITLTPHCAVGIALSAWLVGRMGDATGGFVSLADDQRLSAWRRQIR
jgi:hypothetical protein